MSQPTDPHEMHRHVDWPFADGRFPPQLGAVVQSTVLSGEMPALLVVHADDNSWLVGDGVNDPNGSGGSVATHIWHAIALNSSIANLADLPLGSQARREAPGQPWEQGPHEWDD